jgi:hypothetical protein
MSCVGLRRLLCFAVGLGALLPMLTPRLFSRYWPVMGYLSVLLVVAPTTPFPGFVLLQILSLTSAVVFSIAYFERQRIGGRTGFADVWCCARYWYTASWRARAWR